MRTRAPQKSRESRTSELVSLVEASLVPLIESALAGRESAIEAIVSLAARLASECSLLACEHAEKANSVARKRTSWPINVDPHPDIFRRQLRWLRVLPIGEETGWNPTGRRPYSLSPVGKPKRITANIVIATELQTIAFETEFGLRSKERLSFAEIWRRIMARHNGRPELNAHLRKIGEFRAISKARNGTYRAGSETYENNVRDGLRERLKGAFRVLVRTTSPKDRSGRLG
jgi:hypothetical protein